jgi:HD-GYP domain-containing protein (c-di-GMP phosphodiesterase class II)
VENYQNLIRESMAGPIHDLGKICIPLKILKKTNPLTRTERGIIEHHTSAGYVLLSYYLKDSDSFLAKVAKEHHERRDGSGYPLGISVTDQMLEIIMVSDIYDALISTRPYRGTAYDNRTALEELTRMAAEGKLGWDVVKALVACNRGTKPHYKECIVSTEERGAPPKDNRYGIINDVES